MYCLFHRLCANIHHTSSQDGFILMKDIFSKYKDSCIERCVSPVSNNSLVKVFHKIFPNLKNCRRVINGSRENVYIGLSWKNKMEKSQLNPFNEKDLLNPQYPCIILKQTFHLVTLIMATNIISNGNRVKEITLDFQNHSWSLKVMGKRTNLEIFGISSKFDGTKECFNAILHITSCLNICLGLLVENKQHIPIHIKTESVSTNGDENSHALRMRCNSCRGVLSWYLTGESCRSCIMNLNTFKNEKQEKLINLDKCDDDDLTVIFGEIFPNAPENMKDFLMAQHKI